ncbi:hypothetical protein [Pseudomonas sp. S36]|uniref:hypothetical protein n=1 Tax=Pseudomonas sp. S36 TaxID=2767447 RepID=UPI0019124C39|nr:hypothetical protein [Pseudomonas sp. S36]
MSYKLQEKAAVTRASSFLWLVAYRLRFASQTGERQALSCKLQAARKSSRHAHQLFLVACSLWLAARKPRCAAALHFAIIAALLRLAGLYLLSRRLTNLGFYWA